MIAHKGCFTSIDLIIAPFLCVIFFIEVINQAVCLAEVLVRVILIAFHF